MLPAIPLPWEFSAWDLYRSTAIHGFYPLGIFGNKIGITPDSLAPET
jgi:hypothetical protein